jgi:hypothetical protein
MPEPPDQSRIAEAEIELKRKDLDLRELELRNKLASEKRNVLLASPLLIAGVSAVFALLGTGVGAALQGFWNTRLERQKFEAGLVQDALKTTDKDAAAKNLLFLVNAGLLETMDVEKIAGLARKPDQLPVESARSVPLAGPEIDIRDAKLALQKLGFYRDRPDHEDNESFRSALRKFQESKGISENGQLGPNTVRALLPSVPPPVPPSSEQHGIHGPS